MEFYFVFKIVPEAYRYQGTGIPVLQINNSPRRDVGAVHLTCSTLKLPVFDNKIK